MSRNPEGRGFDSSSRQPKGRRSSALTIEHAELLRSTPSYVLCCAWLVNMALHVHCGLGQFSPLPTSGDDKWVAAKHCGRLKRSRISNTHRLRSSLQFRYINTLLSRPALAQPLISRLGVQLEVLSEAFLGGGGRGDWAIVSWVH